jgi:hypothetical protein
VSPVSDLHAWPSRPTVESAFAEFEAFRDRLRTLVSLCDRDDPVRTALIGELFAFDDLVEKVRPAFGVPAGVRATKRRDVGEDTQAWLSGQAGQMRRNRGPQ